MRRTLLTLTLLLLTGTAWAAEPAVNTNPVFGGGVCGSPFVCAGPQSKVAAIVASANACARQLLGMNNSSFDANGALDSSNCIVSKSSAKSTSGLTLSAKCCIVPLVGSGDCQLTCTQYGLR